MFCTCVKSHAQSIDDILNTCISVFNERQENLYDEAETYINSIVSDSIEGYFNRELMFHTCKGFIYADKYKDWDKSIKELEIVQAKLETVKNLPEFMETYKSILSAIGYFLMDNGQNDKAAVYFNKLLISEFVNEYDPILYNAYSALASIYEMKQETILAKNCHDKCQEFLLKSYIQKYPDYAFYLDNYNSFKYAIQQYENKKNNNIEAYINNLCSLGTLLHKVDQGEYWEPFLVLTKANRVALDNGKIKAAGLGEGYITFVQIITKHVPEPTKSQIIDQLLPSMIENAAGEVGKEDIYGFIASSYGANQFYEKAIEYDEKALEIVLLKEDNEIRVKNLYQRLVDSYLGLRSDSANQIAYKYLTKLQNIVTEKDSVFYDWCIEEKGIILRYLYRMEEAVQQFESNKKYFKKKYGMHSDMYISSLNQLSLCYPTGSSQSYTLLKEAKELITSANTGSINNSTQRGVCVNLANYLIENGMLKEALDELQIAKQIEIEIFGSMLPLTKDLMERCTQ